MLDASPRRESLASTFRLSQLCLTANLEVSDRSEVGEDLTPFRDASKHLYAFLRSFSWNSRVQRLGLDEVSLSFLAYKWIDARPPTRPSISADPL
jgi:hypothetical protein